MTKAIFQPLKTETKVFWAALFYQQTDDQLMYFFSEKPNAQNWFDTTVFNMWKSEFEHFYKCSIKNKPTWCNSLDNDAINPFKVEITGHFDKFLRLPTIHQ